MIDWLPRKQQGNVVENRLTKQEEKTVEPNEVEEKNCERIIEQPEPVAAIVEDEKTRPSSPPQPGLENRPKKFAKEPASDPDEQQKDSPIKSQGLIKTVPNVVSAFFLLLFFSDKTKLWLVQHSDEAKDPSMYPCHDLVGAEAGHES